MDDLNEGAPVEGAPEAVSANHAASEATENTSGQPGEAPADADAAAQAKAEAEENERKSRNERRREARERLVREAQEAQARADEAERRAKTMRDALAGRPMPKPEAFPSFEDYQAELAARRTLGILKAEQADELLRVAQGERQRIEDARRAEAQVDAQHWAAQQAEAKARYSDFEQVALRDAPINEPLAKVIVQSDMAAEIAYWLGKNPAECQRIAALPPMQMARAVGHIEARLSAPPPPPVTSAPAPLSPVRPKASSGLNPEAMSMREYEAARRSGKIR